MNIQTRPHHLHRVLPAAPWRPEQLYLHNTKAHIGLYCTTLHTAESSPYLSHKMGNLFGRMADKNDSLHGIFEHVT